jgi:predicted porin
MMGGLKLSSRVAMLAAAGVLSSGMAAKAADLGGNCCADLEERVAELEATTARKGNRRVSLTISGHVNEAVMYFHDGVDSDVRQVTNTQSMTRFRFRGDATINSDWSAGYYLEFGLLGPGSSHHQSIAAEGELGVEFIRHQVLFIRSKRWGTLHVGHTSTPTDGISEMCLGCTTGDSSAQAASLTGGAILLRDAAGTAGATLSTYIVDPEQGRQSQVRYTSPTLAGFQVQAAWMDEEAASDPDGISAALRYAGEWGAYRVAGVVGWSDQSDVETVAGSLAVSHTPTGLYVSAGAGSIERVGNADDDMWRISAGINRRINSLGSTHLGFYYSHSDVGGVGDSDTWGGSIQQNIDAAAAEIYLQYHNVQASDINAGELQDVDIVLGGMRIRF